jgi:protease-4
VGGDTLAATIREASIDDGVKALVLRIDSPGGSAFASEVIRQALVEFRAGGKPLVASMGSVAASGGYWIAAPADEVWASPTTLTGSIGVLSAFPSVARALDAMGVHSDGVGTTAVAGAFDITRPLSDKVRTVLSLTNQHIYERFIAIVAEGRRLDAKRVAEIAEGRVWTGAQAAGNGLVDHLGDIDDAVTAAARLAKLERYETQYLEKPRTLHQLLLARLSHAATRLFGGALATLRDLRALAEPLEMAARLNDPRGQYALCLACGPL